MRVLALLALLALQLPLVAALDNGLALVPPRGWRSWNQVSLPALPPQAPRAGLDPGAPPGP